MKVEHILSALTSTLKPGEFLTAREIEFALFPKMQLTKRQIATFIKVHGREFFSIYLRRDDHRLIANVYCVKPENGTEHNEGMQELGVE